MLFLNQGSMSPKCTEANTMASTFEQRKELCFPAWQQDRRLEVSSRPRICPYKEFHTNMYSSVICNSPKAETIQLFIIGWRNNCIPYMAILSNKKEWTTCTQRQQGVNYTKYRTQTNKQQQQKEYVVWDSIIWSSRKSKPVLSHRKQICQWFSQGWDMEGYGKGIPEVHEETFQVIDVLVILSVMIVFWM